MCKATDNEPVNDNENAVAVVGATSSSSVPSNKETKESSLFYSSQWPEDPPRTAGTDGGAFFLFDCIYHQFQNWTYSYMNLVLDKGREQTLSNGTTHLTKNDLFPVPVSMTSNHLVQLYEEYEFKEETNKKNNKNNHNNDQDHNEQQQEQQLVLRILWKIASSTYIAAGLCELIVVICGTTLPLLVRQLLQVLEDHPNQNIIREGLPFAIGIFLTSLINGFANHKHRHLALKTGITIRSAIINILYQHILSLSPTGKYGLTTGEITNLIAVDTQKLYEVTQEGHLIWALPLSIILVTYFLYDTLGSSIFIGIIVLIAFVPIIQQVTSKMLQIRSIRVKYTDQRVELVSTMLQGMKVTKLNHYEFNYKSRITKIRTLELQYLQHEMAIWATTLLMTVTSPVLATAATFTTYVLLDNNNNNNSNNHILTAADTFGVLLLFSALRFPINFAGRLIGKAAQALSAIKRIALFLNRPLRDDNDDDDDDYKDDNNDGPTNRNDDEIVDTENIDTPLKLSKASFRIGGDINDTSSTSGKKEEHNNTNELDMSSRDMTSFSVSEFNFSISKGEVIAVCGPVGSGKTTLLHGILQEAEALGGISSVTKHGKISYVPQTAFIMNCSVRDNILFGLPMEWNRYNEVLDACCLRTDLEQLGVAGDMTEIGERGVTLSGGQKQRISLARAAYAKSALVILDDPFSALDSGTGKVVFERLIASEGAVLRDSAVLLVTHASHFISHRAVDQILLLAEGRNQFLGSWEELTVFEPKDDVSRRAVEFIQSSVREETEEDEEDGQNEKTTPGVNNLQEGEETEGNKDDQTEKGRLIQLEQREHGLSSLKTWLLWFQRAGGVPFFSLQILFMFLDRSLYVAVEWFLARWTSAADGPVNILGFEFPAQTEGLSAQSKYLTVYATLILLSIIATFLRSEWAVTGGGRATKNVFFTMLDSVLRAPISYFESVPMGRVLNRFTYDTDVNDVNLTQVMSMFMISCSWYVAGVAIQTTILPWSALVIVPVSVMYWVLMLHYRMSGPDLQRLDALSRSPLQSMVNECLEGSTSIRVFHQDKNFIRRFRDAADINSSALLNFVSAQRWLGVRMELLGSLVVLVSSVLVVCWNDTLGLETGLVGLLIMWSSNFTITLNFLVDTFSETEAAITAIERVDAMADLPFEKPMETKDEDAPTKSWPETGLLEFDKVSLRYREGLPLALNELSFKIPAGKSCGVVGRTGAGKSSITVALFRLVEIESGRILLDGIDLGRLGLSDVRGRGMAIIPQDPFLAGANLRECLDPFGLHTDRECVAALQSVRMGNTSTSASEDNMILSAKLEEGGSNYSAGERQLLNLARALLSQPKLLVLDEATASIDGETDAFIQRMLRTRFPHTTLVTIAHRLNTIMDYDLVLVMDAGHAVEFASPAELLDIPGGVFSELVNSTGAESAKALRDMAQQPAAVAADDTDIIEA